MSSISSFEIDNVVVPELWILLWMVSSVADAAVVNPNSIKTILANGLSTLLVKGNPFFSNDPWGLPRIPPDYTILGSLVFDNFI